MAGLDVAFLANGTARGAVAVLRFPDLEVVEEATAERAVILPYIPGLFSFREIPPLLDALEKLRVRPDVLVCDGQGYAHPRRFGLACHLGVLTDLPAIGVAKTRLLGEHGELAPERGARVPLLDGGEVVGEVVRTRTGVRPVYVSAGYRISLDTAVRLTLEMSRFRLPEPIRRAHHLSVTVEIHGAVAAP